MSIHPDQARAEMTAYQTLVDLLLAKLGITRQAVLDLIDAGSTIHDTEAEAHAAPAAAPIGRDLQLLLCRG